MSSIHPESESNRYLSTLYLQTKTPRVCLQKTTLRFTGFVCRFKPAINKFTFKVAKLVKNLITRDSSS